MSHPVVGSGFAPAVRLGMTTVRQASPSILPVSAPLAATLRNPAACSRKTGASGKGVEGWVSNPAQEMCNGYALAMCWLAA